MATDPPMSTEYVVLRAEGELSDSDLPRSVESVWRKRTDLDDQQSIDVLGPAGNMRAYPTARTETAPDGSVAQVYEVKSDAAEEEAARTGDVARNGHGEPSQEAQR